MSGLPNLETPGDIDLEWVARELMPFLELVFGETYGREKRATAHWVCMVLFARFKLDRVPFHEDFPSTIERLRLCLVNPDILTPSELKKFTRVVAQGEQLCIRIFVRHAIRHGTYKLYSLGSDASPDFPRPGKTDEVVRPGIKFPEPEYAAVMDELQKQLDGASIGGSEKNGNSWKSAFVKYKSEYGNPGYAGVGADVSRAQPGRPLLNAMNHHTSLSGHMSHTAQTLGMPLTSPIFWPQHIPGPLSGYPQPYNTSYPDSYGMHGPSIVAPMHMNTLQCHQQSPPHIQYQNSDEYPFVYQPNEMCTRYATSYHLPQTSLSCLPPVTTTMKDAYTAQHVVQSFASEQVRFALDPGLDQTPVVGVSRPGSRVHVPRPDAEEFVPGVVNGRFFTWGD